MNVHQAILSLEAALEEGYPGEYLDPEALRIVLAELTRYRASQIGESFEWKREYHTTGDGTEVEFIVAHDDEWHASFPVFDDPSEDEIRLRFLASKAGATP